MVCNPCRRCRLADASRCDDVTCRRWQRWWLQQWEQTRKIWGVVPVAADPCGSCVFPKQDCATPCPARRAWEEEVGS